MKCDRVKLAEWIGDITDGFADIPWPMVHEQAGSELITWLTQQDLLHCQMIIDKDQKGINRSLWAEFYDADLRAEYALRFNK